MSIRSDVSHSLASMVYVYVFYSIDSLSNCIDIWTHLNRYKTKVINYPETGKHVDSRQTKCQSRYVRVGKPETNSLSHFHLFSVIDMFSHSCPTRGKNTMFIMFNTRIFFYIDSSLNSYMRTARLLKTSNYRL